MDNLAATCKALNNANRSGKRQILIRKTSRNVLDFLLFMQKHGYLNKITHIDDHRAGKVVCELNGRLVKCGAICPRYNVKCIEVENWRGKLLPARQFGHVVFSTNFGYMDQDECLHKGIGGNVIGFFY